VNSASYCEVLLKLLNAIRRKPPDQLARVVLLYHENVRLSSGRATQKRIQEPQWELLEHPPYGPDFGSSDLYLLGALKTPSW
jgi:hypothetical protein